MNCIGFIELFVNNKPSSFGHVTQQPDNSFLFNVLYDVKLQQCCTRWSDITGETWQQKIALIRDELSAAGADLYVITALDETACEFAFKTVLKVLKVTSTWLLHVNYFVVHVLLLDLSALFSGTFNLRGSDMEESPLFYSYGIVTDSEVRLVVMVCCSDCAHNYSINSF